jgi:hypothetical protein
LSSFDFFSLSPMLRRYSFALEAFFTELSRRASALEADERASLKARIETARELLGGRDAVDRFLRWSLPSDCASALRPEQSRNGE